MLKKLRLKFIVYNMVIATLVLAVVFSTVCVIDYRTRLDDIYNSLSAALRLATTSLYDNRSSNIIHGSVPLDLGYRISSSDDAALISQKNEATTSPSEPREATNIAGNYPQIGTGNESSQSIPMAVYILAPDNTTYVLTNLTTALIPAEVRDRAIQQASAAVDSRGLLQEEGLFYTKRTAFGYTCMAFADAAAVSSWKGLAVNLACVGVGAMVALFLISLFFSRWVLKPVSDAWQAQAQFTADASHELKTPLTVILANMSILQSHPEDSIASQSQWIESTQTEAKQMQQMVNDMLDLARPEDPSRIKMLMVDTDLSDLVEGDALQFESVAFERGITLTSDIDENVHIRGDVNRLHRLTSTLIDNACKYADENGQVDIALKRHSRDVYFSVHNTGPTIDEEDLPHVFDRFYRADKSRNRTSGSYGLGLAIAQEVAREHGGYISAESSPETGTTFTVVLPLPKDR